MAQPINQFYYIDQGRPVLKTEYDDGSEDFYDASGQFPGATWGNMDDGTVIDPYADMASQQANSQAQQPQFQFSSQGGTLASPTGAPTTRDAWANATPQAPQGSAAMPTNPLTRRPEDDPSHPNYQAPGMTAQSQPGQPSTPGVPPSPTIAPRPPGGGSQDPMQGKQMDRYDWAGNPRQAMLNAMADVGGYQMTNNPYVDRLLSAAPALATSFMGRRGLQGASGGDIPTSYLDFGRFLQEALKNNSVFSEVQGAQSLFPQLIGSVRDYNAASSSGATGQQDILSNPFIQQLAAMFGTNNNQGALGAYGQLFSPFMTGAQQRPFSDMMEARYTQGAKGFYEGGNANMPGTGGNDWWKYLFGY